METIICGWQIPGYPKYICIKEKHDNVPKDCEPKWYSDRLYLAALRIKEAQNVESS